MSAIMAEQSKTDSNEPVAFRPPQHVLDILTHISENSDDVLRKEKVVKLSRLIEDSGTEDQLKLLNYCKNRLIRGLSSNRKFARVAFSLALTHLLRVHKDLKTRDVLHTMKHELKLSGQEKKKKSDVTQIILGKAFGFSSLIQSGRLAKLTNDELEPILDEMLALSMKKSVLKPICNSIMEDLVKQVSLSTFAECVWPRIKDWLKEGWEGCSLDKLALVLVTRASHADVVTKKFLKRHFGHPVFSNENDEKLIKVILGTVAQKTDILLKKILPSMLQDGRTHLSIWKGLGEPLISKALEKKTDSSHQRQLLGLKLATYLLNSTNEKEQIIDLMASPNLAPAVFNNITSSKQDPLAVESKLLFDLLCKKVKTLNLPVDKLVGKLWGLAANILDDTSSNTKDIITSTNFQKLMDMMEKEEAVKLAESIVETVKGKNKTLKLSESVAIKKIQIESCLRCLQHVVTSQLITSGDLQKMVVPLLLRLSFFNVTKKKSAVQHCDTLLNLEEGTEQHKLCKSLFFKTLDQLSTTAGGSSKKKSDRLNCFVELLVHLTEYIQELINVDHVESMEEWTDEMKTEWAKVFKLLGKMQMKNKDQRTDDDTAFLLLFLFLAFKLLTDFKTAVDLLQEVQVCYEKTNNKKKRKHSESETEPTWQEVLTEVLLSLMSLESHLGRVIACDVLSALTPHMTPSSTQLITQVLILKPGRGDDADGAMIEEENDDDEDEMVDDDVADEESEEDSDEEEEEEEEEIDVDDQFRASVKEALGAAADDDGDEEQELSDLSDSEMFKLDDMLAEVFRQKKKTGQGKKKREDKKRQMATFRLRVLDLVEVLVKGDRCGDFVLDIMRPLLLLILKSDADDSISVKAKSIFKLLGSKAKGLTDSAHSANDQCELLRELLDLAHSVSEKSQVTDVSCACHIIMNLKCCGDEGSDESCTAVVQNTLKTVIMKGKAKPPPTFFSSMINCDASKYQFLLPMLVDCLKDADSLKVHSKMYWCSVMSTLVSRSQAISQDTKNLLINAVVPFVSKTILCVDASNNKSLFTKEMLNLAVVIQKKQDLSDKSPFGQTESQHIKNLKFKSADLRRLKNAFIAATNRTQNSHDNDKKNKKRKLSESQTQCGSGHNGVNNNDSNLSNGSLLMGIGNMSTQQPNPNNTNKAKRKLSIGEESVSKKKRTQNEPFRRVKSEEVNVDPKFMNNSFEAKKGSKGSWGEKANKDLIITKGKSFKHEKTKKKRGSYKGGVIDASSVHSVKFDSD